MAIARKIKNQDIHGGPEDTSNRAAGGGGRQNPNAPGGEARGGGILGPMIGGKNRVICGPMGSPDRFIASCHSWNDFWERTKRLPSDAEKGAAFERLIQLYLRTTPEYRTELQHVWLLREVSPDIRTRINLPLRDEGVDLIARTRRGEYWAIQAKFRSRDLPLNRRELGTFSSLGSILATTSRWRLLRIPPPSPSASVT